MLLRQLEFFFKIAREPDSRLRRTVFQPGSFELRTSPDARRRGRPRRLWPDMVFKEALAACGGQRDLEIALGNASRTAKLEWKQLIRVYVDAAR